MRRPEAVIRLACGRGPTLESFRIWLEGAGPAITSVGAEADLTRVNG